MILVSGGTGMVGSAVVAELLKRGEPVGVLGRDRARVQTAFAGTVEAREADVTRPETLTQAFEGVDILINAVQFPTSPIEVPRKGWTFEAVDYKGTVNQVEAAKAAGVKRFVFVSGVGAAPDAQKHWFRFKWQAEEAVRQSGLEWVIVRPTWVYGPRDVSLNRLLNFSNFLPFVPMFGDGNQAMQPVFVEDVGRVVATCATKTEAANQLFELGGPEVMSMNDVLRAGLEAKGRKRPILHQPMFVGRLIGSIMSRLPITPPLTADAVEFIAAPAVADTANLQRVLAPELTPVRVGLGTYLKR